MTQQLSNNCIDTVFDSIKQGLINNPSLVSYIDNIDPKNGEVGIHWRHQLKGFTDGLIAAKLLTPQACKHLNDILFSDKKRKRRRSKKSAKFNVEIINENGKAFVFDVPSDNPLDAYVQLTKRTAYKSIPDIKKVDVYAGFLSDRTPERKPLRTFNSEELVFVTLL